MDAKDAKISLRLPQHLRDHTVTQAILQQISASAYVCRLIAADAAKKLKTEMQEAPHG